MKRLPFNFMFFPNIKNHLKLVAFLLVFNLFVHYAFSQQMNIYPTILNFQLSEPGSVETQTINITNNSEKSQAIEAYLGDWNRNEDGSHTYYEAGSQAFSCAKWIKISSNFAEIAPGASAQLIVTIQSPTDPKMVEAMKWAMLFIQGTTVREKVDEQSDGVKTQINEMIRFGVHLYQTPSNLKLNSAKASSLLQNKENTEAFDMAIENDGQVMVRAKSYLELTNIATGQEYKGEIEECPLFPLSKRIVSLHLPENLPKGKYSMLGILDYGNPNSLEAIERIIEIK